MRLPEGPQATFSLLWIPVLTRRTLPEVLEAANQQSSWPLFISYRESSAEAREALHAAGISFAGGDGRAFVRAPGILIERHERPNRVVHDELHSFVDASVRNPFAKRNSRIPRWLLLHHDKPFFVGELAREVDLSSTTASRVLRGLEDAAFVRDTDSDFTGRRRTVRLERPRALLDAWLPVWQRRRIAQRRWDIGARDAREALRTLGDAVAGQTTSWAVGGLAGAAMFRRAVEPADVLIWTIREEVPALEHILQPAPARGERGTLRVAVAPDPWTLGLTQPIDGLPVSDIVQLWLDCGVEGERALEAADTVAEIAGWS